ncbi:hypothetical protein AB205_0035530 [Aquarana catesbeiana]|uniref:Uncharacterized protein n=1 Tax=Aquarana catesbeiana TaxID=8400 RepID=A0A2G9S8G4_AQUCT|nr:hypothetical protein AB205_0035530 [Aquarana catesbeiana]
MFSAWNSAKTDSCTTLPSNVSYSYFWPQISVLSICFFNSHKGEKIRRTPGTLNLIKKVKSQHHNLRMWRKERFMKWAK